MIYKAFKMLKRHEGWRAKPYIDTTGNITVGYGFNLEVIKMPKQVGKLWLFMRCMKVKSHLNKQYSWFSQIDSDRQAAFIDMAYQLGNEGFDEFQAMIGFIPKAIVTGNWNNVAKEALDSHWAEQVPNRANEIAAILRDSDNVGI